MKKVTRKIKEPLECISKICITIPAEPEFILLQGLMIAGGYGKIDENGNVIISQVDYDAFISDITIGYITQPSLKKEAYAALGKELPAKKRTIPVRSEIVSPNPSQTK